MYGYGCRVHGKFQGSSGRSRLREAEARASAPPNRSVPRDLDAHFRLSKSERWFFGSRTAFRKDRSVLHQFRLGRNEVQSVSKIASRDGMIATAMKYNWISNQRHRVLMTLFEFIRLGTSMQKRNSYREPSMVSRT